MEVSASNVQVEIGEEEEDEGAKERTELMPESAPQESVPFVHPKKESKGDLAGYLSSIKLEEFPKAPKEATNMFSGQVIVPLFGLYLLLVALGGIFM